MKGQGIHWGNYSVDKPSYIIVLSSEDEKKEET